MSNMITEVRRGAREVFVELSTKDTRMTDLDRDTDKENLESQPLLTRTKKLY